VVALAPGMPYIGNDWLCPVCYERTGVHRSNWLRNKECKWCGVSVVDMQLRGLQFRYTVDLRPDEVVDDKLAKI
jgi:hypothetical protein